MEHVAVIGAGKYGGRVLISACKTTKASLVALANTGGVTAIHYGRWHGFERVTTDLESILSDSDIGTLVITTKDESHVNIVAAALRVGKHTSVEKPLAMTKEGLGVVQQAWSECSTNSPKILVVGSTRGFASLIQRIKNRVTFL